MKIYIIHSCDEWKSLDSYRLVFVGTSLLKAKRFLLNEIKRGNMKYLSGTATQQTKTLQEDWSRGIKVVSSNLTYGDIDYVENNTEI